MSEPRWTPETELLVRRALVADAATVAARDDWADVTARAASTDPVRPTPPPQLGGPRRTWLAAAAVIVVAAIGGAVVLLGGEGDRLESTATESTPPPTVASTVPTTVVSSTTGVSGPEGCALVAVPSLETQLPEGFDPVAHAGRGGEPPDATDVCARHWTSASRPGAHITQVPGPSPWPITAATTAGSYRWGRIHEGYAVEDTSEPAWHLLVYGLDEDEARLFAQRVVQSDPSVPFAPSTSLSTGAPERGDPASSATIDPATQPDDARLVEHTVAQTIGVRTLSLGITASGHRCVILARPTAEPVGVEVRSCARPGSPERFSATHHVREEVGDFLIYGRAPDGVVEVTVDGTRVAPINGTWAFLAPTVPPTATAVWSDGTTETRDIPQP